MFMGLWGIIQNAIDRFTSVKILPCHRSPKLAYTGTLLNLLLLTGPKLLQTSYCTARQYAPC